MKKVMSWGVLFVSLATFVNCSGDEEVTQVSPEIRGGRGESCLARNDCREGLACINNVCTQNDFEIAVSAKSCERIECEVNEDCCPQTLSSSCATLKAQCDAGDTISCSSFELSCTCQSVCDANRCVSSRTCTTDDDCFGGLNRRCVETKCVQCTTDTDCLLGGDGAKCVANRCSAGCTDNDDCPIFHACTEGACVESGCTSDRECYLATENPRARCTEKKCQVPCEVDAECPKFNMCNQGSCVFVGCETNEECKIYLGQSELPIPTKGKAVCR